MNDIKYTTQSVKNMDFQHHFHPAKNKENICSSIK